jgi:hypothetical protein
MSASSDLRAQVNAVMKANGNARLYDLEANGGGGWTIRLRPPPQGSLPPGEGTSSPTVDALATLAGQLRAAGMTVERMPVRTGSYLWVRD